MIKIGVVLKDFGPSQLAYEFLSQTNKLLRERFDIAPYGFFENLGKPVISPNFSLMNLTEAYGFDGILITTSAYQTFQTINYPGPKRHIFYSYDLDFLSQKGQAEFYFQCYRNTESWTRNQVYSDLVKNNFNIESKVNPDFNLESFING